jgi:tripartite-type tricarboxylate transporter receptor subunit TctC
MEPQAVQEMRAAIAKTLADPELIAESQKRGLPLHFYSGESEQARVQRAMDGGKDLAPVLKAAAQSIK